MTRGEIETEIDELVGEGHGDPGASRAGQGARGPRRVRGRGRRPARDAPREGLHRRGRAPQGAPAPAGHRAAVPPRRGPRGRRRGAEPRARDRSPPRCSPTSRTRTACSGSRTSTAQRLIDRYNVALAQAVLLRSVLVTVEVRNEKPARYRQLFRQLKFHRLLYRVEGDMDEGYVFHIDGPLSLFSATNKYGLQMALFLPALLHCHDFRLDAELRWGPEARAAELPPRVERRPGLAPGRHRHVRPGRDRRRSSSGSARSRPAWEVTEATDVIELGREGVWVPDYRFVHKATGTRRLRRGRRLLEAVEPRAAAPPLAPARPAAVRPGDLRPSQGRRGGPRRAPGPGPPVQGDPQRPRAGGAARPVPRAGRARVLNRIATEADVETRQVRGSAAPSIEGPRHVLA